jgi:glycosyltransferase involved in cell wall biosynthesis
MKKIVFLGYVVAPDEVHDYKGISIAGNKMQWNVVKNMSYSDDLHVECITITPRAVFPSEKKMYQNKEVVNLLNDVKSYRVPYLNIPLIKQISQIFSVYTELKRLIETDKIDSLLCFNLFPQVGIPMRLIKKKYPQIDTVCLLADLPIDDKPNRKGVSKFLRHLFDKSTWKSMNKCDRYIVLNESVFGKYLPYKPYIVVDGGIDDDMRNLYNGDVKKNDEKNILYCGSLAEYSGVRNLLKAFESIPSKDIYLDIYGSGNLQDEILEASKRDCRIRFHGRINNNEMLRLQREAWVLINPRSPSDPIAQVTFPSKTFEYLLSGTPVISTRLNCYGKEYNDLMFYTVDGSAESIAQKIIEVDNMNPMNLQSISIKAKRFVEEKRTWSHQVDRIVAFLTNY